MSAARRTFCERIGIIRKAIDDFKLQDLPAVPANASHNNSARIIRNGLAVQCFNIFEDFIKRRTAELLTSISGSGVSFAFLPEKLRRATTVDCIKAVDYQMRLQDKASRVQFAQNYAERISSTKNPAIQLPDIAFFHAASNISKDHFRDSLASFAVENPWTQVSGLSSRAGLSALPADSIFDSFAERRHSAAHDPNASISEVDLMQSLLDASGLASAFDILISRCAVQISGLTAALAPNASLVTDHASISIRFVRFHAGQFGEIREGGNRFFRRSIDLAALLPGATNRAKKDGGVLFVFNSFGLLGDWAV